MRILRLAIALTLATLASGCAGGGHWPAGTEAAFSPPNIKRMLVRVPIDQKERAGGRNWVSIDSGTRVVCLEDFDFNGVKPSQSNPHPGTDIRVRVAEGMHDGLEVFMPRGALSGPVDPTPPESRAALLLLGWVILISLSAASLIATAAKASRRRREVIRHWIAAHPGERPPNRTRRHRSGHGAPSACVEDQAEWAEWLASRNARTRDRMTESVSCYETMKSR